MPTAELKNKKTRKSVVKFIHDRATGKRREDALTILEMMKSVTKAEPAMWGESIIGFGEHHYVYASGREIDWFLVGFSVRKDRITLYLTCDLDQFTDELEKLGPYSRGAGCLYLKKLDGVHLPTLRKMIRKAVSLVKNSKNKSDQRS